MNPINTIASEIHMEYLGRRGVMTGTWAGGPASLRRCSRRDPADATTAVTEGTQTAHGAPAPTLAPLSTPDWLLRFPGTAVLVVGFGELGGTWWWGAFLASLPPVAW